MKNRQTAIRAKGFDMIEDHPKNFALEGEDNQRDEIEFARMRTGLKNVEDAVINLSAFRKTYGCYYDKNYILNAMYRHDYQAMRKISNYFYENNGIYQRICKYLAYLYKYDWFVTPFITSNKSESKILTDFTKVLEYLDNSDIKRTFGNIALDLMKNGVYYGMVLDFNDKFTFQQLPVEYCRVRYFSGTDPLVELNMRFFDSCFPNVSYRLEVLQLFPKEVQKAYVLFKEGKLVGDYPGDQNGWYKLDPATTVRFTLGGDSQFPPFVSAIPAIIDLDLAQELDRKKAMQQLLKIIIQKLPLDKNGDLIFDVDEAKDIHNNAVAMLKRAVGVDVLTTFADVDVADMSNDSDDSNNSVENAENTVYNNLGMSQNLFNTDGNIALEKSIANDEAMMRDLLYQFKSILNRVISKFNRNGHYSFKVDLLETTIYNYKDISKLYKDQTSIGFSKVLPQVALGHSQSSIIATASFENEVLNLQDIMIPPMSSNTMSAAALQQSKSGSKSSTSSSSSSANNSGSTGRPEKEDDQKSEKTIANKEAMG